MATFFLCLFFADEVSSSVQAYRSQLVAIDLGFNGLWCFLFFIAFCWTTNMWTAGDATCFQIAGADAKFKKMKDCSDGYPKDVCFTDGNINAAGTGIAFSFFCTLLFGALCFFSAQKMSRGDSGKLFSVRITCTIPYCVYSAQQTYRTTRSTWELRIPTFLVELMTTNRPLLRTPLWMIATQLLNPTTMSTKKHCRFFCCFGRAQLREFPASCPSTKFLSALSFNNVHYYAGR